MKATGSAFHKFRSTLKTLVIGMSLALFVPAVEGQQAPVPASSPVEGNPQAVLNYWTAARMQQAVPIDLPQASGQEAADDFITSTSNEPEAFDPSAKPKSATNDTVSQLLDSLATSNAPFTLASGYSYPFPFTRYDVAPLLYAPQLANGLAGVAPSFPYKTVGKLFVTTDAGVNAVCGASVIFDHLLLTARHCIYNQDTGRFFTNITFAPGYFNANNPQLGGVGRADDCTPGHGRPRTGATTSALCNSSTMTGAGAAEVWEGDRLRPTPGTWDRFGAAVTPQSTGTSLAILRLECSMARSWWRRIRAPRKWAGSARGTIRCKSAMT